MRACLWQHDRRTAHETDNEYQAKDADDSGHDAQSILHGSRRCLLLMHPHACR